MNILLVTDSFPPVCGGSGWSTFELARGLRAAAHAVVVARLRPGTKSGVTRTAYDNFEVHDIGVAAPDLPYLRNYLKSERLTRVVSPILAALVEGGRIDVVHGQHVMSAPAARAAAERTGRPFVCTVRDYWPVCYWSTLLVSPNGDTLCAACTTANMRRCTKARAGWAWPLAAPWLPYMQANLRRKHATLQHADAVIAVSTTIARDIAERCPDLDTRRLHTIPNPVDIAALRKSVAETPAPREGAYALFVGKLAPNKGVGKLFDAVERGRLSMPLVVVGDGPDRAMLERRAATTSANVTFTGWLERGETLVWMKHARFLIFPSQGPESLSRVLLESSALGVCAAAMLTGGTGDIVLGEQTGLVSTSVDELARDVARLEGDPELRARLGAAARHHVEQTFDAPRVVERIMAVYEGVLGASPATPNALPDPPSTGWHNDSTGRARG